MKCSVCGSDNLEGSAYCEDCGARLAVGAAVGAAGGGGQPAYTPPPAPPPAPPPEPAAEIPQAVAPPAPPPEEASGTVVCSACGAENPAHEAYCEDCGASLSAARPAGVAPPPSEAVPPPVAAAPPGVVRPRLVVADTGSEVLLEKDEVLIGRRSPVDGIFPEVDLTDVDTESYVSRRHGRIVRQDSQFFYEDLGSSNGSFHNGTRLQRGVQASLQDGDRLRLGKTELVFRVY